MSERNKGFFPELRRRRVLPVAGAYIAIAWLVIEVADFLLEQGGAPGWALRLLAIVFIVGFPVAVALAWIIQVQPDGKRTVDSSRGQHRIVGGAVALGLLATAGLAWLILPRIEDAPGLADYDPLPNSIAILPFYTLDATPQERTIGETLFHALREGLNQSHELTQVRLKLDTVPDDPLTLGRRFRVAALLTGRVDRFSGGARMTLELLDVAANAVRWSHSFDWNPTRIIETGTEAANGVLESMAMPMLSVDRFAGTGDPDAYDALLLGFLHQKDFNVEELRTAMEHFQRAIDLDPGYVRAYLGLAQTINVYVQMKGPPEEERQALTERQREVVDAAYQLDENNADTLSLMGLLETDNEELRILMYERALELDPDNAQTYFRLAWARMGEGSPEEAERLFRRALEFHPQSANYRSDLASALFNLGRVDEAIVEVEQSIELAPNFTSNYRMLGAWNFFHFGRIDEAIYYMRKAYALNPEVGRYASFVANGYHTLGMNQEALAWIDRALELSPTAPWVWVLAGFLHKNSGDMARSQADFVRLLELDPGNRFALRELGYFDIENDRWEDALERWANTYPGLVLPEDPVIDRSNFVVAEFFASNLVKAGFEERGLSLKRACLEVATDLELETEAAAWRFWIESSLEPEEHRDELIDRLWEQIVELNQRAEIPDFSDTSFDFIRDDPKFQEMMHILNEDLARQRERIRAMERNGEMPPAPGVEI